MSVLIKGMEMPKKCGECDIYVCYRTWSGDPGDKFCGITKEGVSRETKPDWCPLFETSELEKGEWIANGDIPKTCPFCGDDWDKYVFGDEIWYTGELPNYCPNCGKPMVVIRK